MTTKVVHCKKESFDVYIGRPSKWGNPFAFKESKLDIISVNSREESILKYKEWILTQPNLLNDLYELKDKILGCWCKPLACHGDVLVELVNELL